MPSDGKSSQCLWQGELKIELWENIGKNIFKDALHNFKNISMKFIL